MKKCKVKKLHLEPKNCLPNNYYPFPFPLWLFIRAVDTIPILFFYCVHKAKITHFMWAENTLTHLECWTSVWIAWFLGHTSSLHTVVVLSAPITIQEFLQFETKTCLIWARCTQIQLWALLFWQVDVMLMCCAIISIEKHNSNNPYWSTSHI